MFFFTLDNGPEIIQEMQCDTVSDVFEVKVGTCQYPAQWGIEQGSYWKRHGMQEAKNQATGQHAQNVADKRILWKKEIEKEAAK